MVIRNAALVVFLLVFGLPFLAITDLFPFHRFGMFARIPEKAQDVSQYVFEVKEPGKSWKKLEAGNPYFDYNYFPLLAEKGFQNPDLGQNLGSKLFSSLEEKPDSIRIFRTKENQGTFICIYP
jgi:hypothetical protein